MALWQRLRWKLRLRLQRQMLLARAIRKRRELRLISDRRASIRKTDSLAVICLRNEAVRLPHFLSHYRKLGVGHFLVIDNASTDGSAALLAAEPDVSVWRTEASYRSARFGLDWTNWLLLRYGHGHWCLTVDADELLVYPNCETRPLPALTKWLESTGQVAMPAMMLELYPEGPLGAEDYRAGEDPLTVLPWFDAGNYSVIRQPKLDNLWIQGGPRARVFFANDPRRAPTLNKLPLVKWHWRYAYLNSTHTALPATLNHVYATAGGATTSGVLLHTKFLPQILEKSAEEKERREHFADPRRFGSYYDGLIEAPVLFCERSTRYTGWRQLEALGLLSRGGWL
ncbi:glycosyltransferase family 2 protein [Xinfangfangia sp. CPCC 101601]|uniref:Glycosyltransferase family 2 protein n=1 Tax=Pseudogemmobacter lacusdianii TaxID=3069608 RepID=A0ABU0VTP1_9RHOB|nr:glycosyltransferase family 2 protein [Xinfangfangia sp. CPCC 101601]MDQ2065101.1 glycosyltransferase family 2 protein [Xinfangfangia sp. CPCC 101601]